MVFYVGCFLILGVWLESFIFSIEGFNVFFVIVNLVEVFGNDIFIYVYLVIELDFII